MVVFRGDPENPRGRGGNPCCGGKSAHRVHSIPACTVRDLFFAEHSLFLHIRMLRCAHMLTDAEVERIMALARLELRSDLRERIQKDVSSILGYVDQLNTADTSGIEPLYQVTGLQNTARPDEHRNDWPMDAQLSELLIGQAPHHEGRHIKVKSVKRTV
jgi:aspartyl-tRNA(Asn)/glutamyl-tRNA(Gln) amidotransferase subunit C